MNGKFNFGNDLVSMPECDAYREENIFEKIGNWFTGSKKEKTGEEKTKEKGKKKKKFWQFGN